MELLVKKLLALKQQKQVKQKLVAKKTATKKSVQSPIQTQPSNWLKTVILVLQLLPIRAVAT
jgi:hypothetical protein